MQKYSKTGSDSNQHSSEKEPVFCPNCDSEDAMEYGVKDLEVDDDGLETVPVEGMICIECGEILMSLEESCRFLNIKAKYDGADSYFGVHNGTIKEGRLH